LLVVETAKFLNIENTLILSTINNLLDKKVLILKEDKFIYQPSIFEQEKYIAEKLKILSKFQSLNFDNIDVDSLADDQIKAMSIIGCNTVSILTGCPGTGKTFTVQKILSSFKDKKIYLAAPSGKAAKRMSEVTGKEALTIHKLLEPQMIGFKFYFSKNVINPIDADIIILDESSMIDQSLFFHFLDAVKSGTRLIFVGDHYQLPAVGAGNILRDMIESGVIALAQLTEIKRQKNSKESLIVKNCHLIKDGKNIIFDNKSKDFFFIPEDSPEKIQEIVYGLFRRIKEKYSADPLRDIQILSPLKTKTVLSCDAFNILLQEKLNICYRLENKAFFKTGDKVIQTKNDYEKNIINGDIGFIKEIDFSSKQIKVNFENPDRLVTVGLNNNDLLLAYCLTVHKSQGSEFDHMILPIHEILGSFLMDRNLLYTAISRAKKTCILVGQKKEISKIIGRNKAIKRFTGLIEALKNN
jgi:exodeoxyribonuclease V alpha subunit